MEWLASEMGSVLLGMGVNYFVGLFGRFRLVRLKRKLTRNLTSQILQKYGACTFYNDLDSFLSNQRFMSALLENCSSAPIGRYKSKSEIVSYYIRVFIEKYPQYLLNSEEIRSLILDCYKIIYETLNDTSSNAGVRAISNTAKELAGELTFTLDNIKNEVLNVGEKVRILSSQLGIEPDEPIVLLDQYFAAQNRVYLDMKGKKYIQRSIHIGEDGVSANAFETLMKYKQVLLLGEAGYGKTFESIELLSRVCRSSETMELVPVYLPLHEYGMLYNTIFDGIKNRFLPFCRGKIDDIINNWLLRGQLVLILDGVDDIQTQESRNKFYAEIRNYILNFEKSFVFVTSRINRYHGELGNIMHCSLIGLNETTVRKQLRDDRIYKDIPYSYYSLFANPMFLEIGKTVLKQNNHKDIFNRSALFEELIPLLCGEWDKKKGVFITQSTNYSDVLNILGRFAFESFDQPSCSLLEFDQFISKSVAYEFRAPITNTIIGSGIIKAIDRAMFSHKIFKEYCAAHFLINNYPFSSNKYFYFSLIQNEAWREVLIFVAGMHKTLEAQDSYLDYIMKYNLALYVECINAKSDLNLHISDYKGDYYTERYLRSILNTYSFIVDYYFNPLKYEFDPMPGKEEEGFEAKQIGIVGYISDDGKKLHYWFDRIYANEPAVVCLKEGQFPERYKQREMRAVETRGTFQNQFINLGLAGLGGDSGRKVAIEHVKDEIKLLLKQRRLCESNYLLAERLKEIKRKVKEIKDSDNLFYMYSVVDKMIRKAQKLDPNIIAYQYGKTVEMFSLRYMLDYMISLGMNYTDSLLSEADRVNVKSPCWMWDFYSTDQKMRRISDFFWFHQSSYLSMIQKNFPMLYQKFHQYLDSPYQTVVLLYLKTDRARDMFSEPLMTYYEIASSPASATLPQIRTFDHEQEYANAYRRADEEIWQSYSLKGKEAHRSMISSTGFTFTIHGRDPIMKRPLSDSVYDSIKSSLEEILGKI